MIKVLVSPNAFKNSLSSTQASEAIIAGLKESNLQCTCQHFPIADGGDQTAELITKLKGGYFVEAETVDALGRLIKAQYGLIEGGRTAVIDMATASGIRLLDNYYPLRATSYGTGLLIKDALTRGIKKILLGVGGSATTDGGTGILEALGAKFYDSSGKPVKVIPEELVRISKIRLDDIHPDLKKCEIVVLCDVDNPLLGERGSARVFGPQKGASESDVILLEDGLKQLNKVVRQITGIEMSSIKHGGAAGGAAAGLNSLLNARLVSGIDYFLEITDFGKALELADFVITGEGSLDEQTLEGKGPFGVAILAKTKKIPVVGLAGKVPFNPSLQMTQYFNIILSINNGPVNLNDSLKNTFTNLKRTATQVGNLLALGSYKSFNFFKKI